VGPAKITVRENEDPVIDDNKSRRKINVTSISGVFDWIDATYDYIERVQQGEHTRPEINGFTYKIRYNEEFHYPEGIRLSTGYIEPVLGGNYYTATITDFTPSGWAEKKARKLLEYERYKLLGKRRSVEVETLFGQIKGNQGYRRFLLRGNTKGIVE
jgi:hypothetical protein